MTDEQYREEEQWVAERMNILFETANFKRLGKENDYIYQALVFLGQASQKLSLARTILKDHDIAPDMMGEMGETQQWVHDFQDHLRELNKPEQVEKPIYASYLMEMKREQRGLDYHDTSQDDEIIKDLQKGEKISKSKHL